MINNSLIDRIYEDCDKDGDFTRKYAIAAFRFYARMNYPCYDELRKAIYDRALEKSKQELIGFYNKGFVSNPTEQAVINAEKAVEQAQGKLKDILAVENSINIIMGSKNSAEIMKCLEKVYFKRAAAKLCKSDISQRVVAASLDIPCCERQVYRYLKTAADIFCEQRGLRIS